MGAKGCAIQNKQGAINIITRKEWINQLIIKLKDIQQLVEFNKNRRLDFQNIKNLRVSNHTINQQHKNPTSFSKVSYHIK
jgi:hypothetical protein